MEPQIISRDEFKVVGLACYSNNKNREIPELWGKFLSRAEEIDNRVDNQVYLGICEYVENMAEGKKFNYLAAVEVSSFDHIPRGMVKKTIPAGRYAVFTHEGYPDSLQDTYNYIYRTWFVESGHVPAKQDDFELYDHRFQPHREDSELDIYIPIE